MNYVFVLLMGITLTTNGFALPCDHDPMSQEFCEDLFAAEDCLDTSSRCSDYVAGAMVQSILLLGKIDVAARHFHRQGRLQGEIGDRFARFQSRLEDQDWQVTSRDPNWLVAAQKIIDITRDCARQFSNIP